MPKRLHHPARNGFGLFGRSIPMTPQIPHMVLFGVAN